MDAAVVARALDDAAAVLDAPVVTALRAGGRFVPRPHGTVMAFAPHRGQPRRVIEIDRHGSLLAALRWTDDALAEATLRIPDGRFITVECGAASDRLWLGRRPGRAGAEPVGEYAAIDYRAIDEIPTLGDPTRLPGGAGTTVLNMIAGLASDARVTHLVYRGPYPSEQLFLSLLESFRYVGDAVDDPLAAFVAGTLAWEPAPHEARYEDHRVVVYLRGRVEKVVWEGRIYYREDWQTVMRHAPRRVRDAGNHVVCSLWILGMPIEDHLALAPGGDLIDIVAPAVTLEPARELPPDAVRAIVAAVAATAIPALATFVREAGRALSAEWDAVARDLVAVDGTHIRIASRVRAAAIARLRDAPDRASRVATAFALVGEVAGLVGDTLRARAQGLLAVLPAAEQAAALDVIEDVDRETSATVIGRGVEALLAELGA